MKKPPPYGRRLVIPETRIIMLYVGEPSCWEAAKEDRYLGLFNHLVLPYIREVDRYKWPINDCVVTVIDFGISDPEEMKNLFFVLTKAGASEVGFREMHNDQISFHVRK